MMRREVIAAWLAERDGFHTVNPATQTGLLAEADTLMEQLDKVTLWTIKDVVDWTQLAGSTISSYCTRRQMPAPTLTFGRTHVWEPDVIKKWRPR